MIHGHNHRSMLAECRSEDGAFPIVGVPSFSAASSAGHGELAAYNIYEIATEPEGSAITLIQRGLKRDAEGVFELRAELISGLMHKQS